MHIDTNNCAGLLRKCGKKWLAFHMQSTILLYHSLEQLCYLRTYNILLSLHWKEGKLGTYGLAYIRKGSSMLYENWNVMNPLWGIFSFLNSFETLLHFCLCPIIEPGPTCTIKTELKWLGDWRLYATALRQLSPKIGGNLISLKTISL